MSNVVRFPDIDQIEVEACDWLARLDNEGLSDGDTAQLHDWLRQDLRHAQILMEVATLQDNMTVLSGLAPLFPLEEQLIRKPETGLGAWLSGLFVPVGIGGAVAATFIAVAMFSSVSGVPEQDPAPIAMAPLTYTTETGEIKTVALADGSRITLNSNSQVEVLFTDSTRALSLASGEALFDVAHEADRPFYVRAAGTIVKAVGTAFNVELGKDNVEVTVTDGVIEITKVFKKALQIDDLRAMARDLSTKVSSSNSSTRRVAAGEVAIIRDIDLPVIAQIDQEDVKVKLAWQHGELVFTGESLDHVIAEVSRYTGTTIVIVDESISNIAIGGRFKTGDVENLLDILEHGFDIKATRVGENLVHLASADPSD